MPEGGVDTAWVNVICGICLARFKFVEMRISGELLQLLVLCLFYQVSIFDKKLRILIWKIFIENIRGKILPPTLPIFYNLVTGIYTISNYQNSEVPVVSVSMNSNEIMCREKTEKAKHSTER